MEIDARVHMDQPKKRINFDPTINLGHILTAIAFLSSGFVAYNNLDKRISLQEQSTVAAQIQRNEKDAAFKETLTDMKSDVRELGRAINDLTKSINSSPKK